MVRLEEVPSVADRRGDLQGFWIDDVMIREVTDEKGSLGWMAMVVLFRSGGRWWDTPIPWMLGLRPTEEEARSAVTELLKGLLKGQKRARRDYPGRDLPKRPVEERQREAVEAMFDEWRERRGPEPKPRGHEGSRPQRTNLPPGVPQHIREWGTLVKGTRTGWKWTQAQLAEKIDLDAARISKLERGIWLPPDDVIAALCDVLDLNPPVESSDG